MKRIVCSTILLSGNNWRQYHVLCVSDFARCPLPTCPITFGKSAGAMVINQLGFPYLHWIACMFFFTSTQAVTPPQKVLSIVAKNTTPLLCIGTLLVNGNDGTCVCDDDDDDDEQILYFMKILPFARRTKRETSKSHQNLIKISPKSHQNLIEISSKYHQNLDIFFSANSWTHVISWCQRGKVIDVSSKSKAASSTSHQNRYQRLINGSSKSSFAIIDVSSKSKSCLIDGSSTSHRQLIKI